MHRQSFLFITISLSIIASLAACGGPWEAQLEELAKGQASSEHVEAPHSEPPGVPKNKCEARVDEAFLSSQSPGFPTPFCDTFVELPAGTKCDNSTCDFAAVWNEGQPENAWQNISCADALVRCEKLGSDNSGQRYCMWGKYRISGKPAAVCSADVAPPQHNPAIPPPPADFGCKNPPKEQGVYKSRSCGKETIVKIDCQRATEMCWEQWLDSSLGSIACSFNGTTFFERSNACK